MENNPIGAFIIFFLNSGFMEFGDELFCLANSAFGWDTFGACHTEAARKINYIENNYTFVAIFGGILGYVLLAPTAFIWYYFYGKPNDWTSIWGAVFKIEVIEGAISVVGQYLTDQNLAIALYSLVLGFGSGILRGGVLAFSHQWSTSTLFQYQVLISAGLVGGVLLHYYGLSPFN